MYLRLISALVPGSKYKITFEARIDVVTGNGVLEAVIEPFGATLLKSHPMLITAEATDTFAD